MEPKSRPILFSGAMVRAILDGTKTQTRRVVKPQPGKHLSSLYEGLVDCHDLIDEDGKPIGYGVVDGYFNDPIKCPYGKPGDRLWVRETWAKVPATAYHHDSSIPHQVLDEDGYKWWAIYKEGWERSSNGWKSPRFMPRWASRIELEIVSVRVERLNDISKADCIAEGGPPSHPSIDSVSRSYGHPDFPRSWYAQLWESINGKGSWALNPWVWVVEFKRVTP